MFIDYVRIFKALADETRLRIIRIFLNGNYNVNEILFVIGGKQSNISHHLKILQDCDLIISKKEGAHVFYRLNLFDEKNISELINIIRKNEKEFEYYNEDIKRLEAISERRKKTAEEYFNSVGEDFDSVQVKLFESIYSVEETMKYFDKLDSILDIGCGTGRNLPVLSKYSTKVYGIDSSPKMIQLSDHICKKNNLNYELKIGDVYQLPFSDGSLGGVFANMVFHHISEPLKAVAEISRTIRSGGIFVLVDLLSHQDEEMQKNYADLWLGFSEEEVSGWLIKNGFRIKEKLVNGNKDSAKKVIVFVSEKV